MIELYKLSFIENQSMQIYIKRNASQSQNTQNQVILKNYLLKIYNKNDKNIDPQTQPLISVKLIKSGHANLRKNIFQQENGETKLKIELKNTQIGSGRYTIFDEEYLFQLCLLQTNKAQKQVTKKQTQIICCGCLNFRDMSSNNSTFVALDSGSRQYVQGSLTCKYNLYSSSQKLINQQQRTNKIYLFSMKVQFYCQNKFKRAYLTFNPNKREQDQQIQPRKDSQRDQQQEWKLDGITKLPIKRINKGWISYRDVFQLQFSQVKNNQKSKLIQIKAYFFDFNTCDNICVGRFRGLLYLDFCSDSQIKFVQVQMFNYGHNNEDECVGIVQFKYCPRLQQNIKKISDITSRIYLQNAYSPSKFTYDPSLFVSNSAIVTHDKLNKSFSRSGQIYMRNPQVMNSNRLNRNAFVKSKFHSVFSSNKAVSMDRQDRFPSPKKKLTDQLGYYGHKTLDINFLPKTQKYRYASFGKDAKICLKDKAFQEIGPGSARYRLPSIFDKYG